jgi:hypothetical protein
MPEIYSEQIWDAVRSLALTAVAVFVFKTARDAAKGMGRWSAGWRSVAWCCGIAAFAAFSLGEPSCEEQGDPLRGGCEVVADDGFEPSIDERLALFVFWALILTTPALFGVADGASQFRPPIRKDTGNV